MAIWNDSTHKNVFPPVQDNTGAWHSCATVRGTSPAEIEYKRTTDLNTWPTVAVFVGTIATTRTRCAVTFGILGEVIVTNGFEFLMESQAQGIAGSWAAVT